jgi:hypothetical protein
VSPDEADWLRFRWIVSWRSRLVNHKSCRLAGSYPRLHPIYEYQRIRKAPSSEMSCSMVEYLTGRWSNSVYESRLYHLKGDPHPLRYRNRKSANWRVPRWSMKEFHVRKSVVTPQAKASSNEKRSALCQDLVGKVPM